MTRGDLPRLDANKVSVARVYDYVLGGHHNFEVDREAARKVIEDFPGFPAVMGSARSFVRRATRHTAGQGVRQWLDLGSGIPTMRNIHEIAQAIDPSARIAYVDLDPVAVVHGRSILRGTTGVTCTQGDIRDPAAICAAPTVTQVIDFTQPVCVVMNCILHFIRDTSEVRSIVDGYLQRVPPGSWLVICHAAAENKAGRRTFSAVVQELTPRSREQIISLFHGCDLADPGVVLTPLWQPSPDSDPGPAATIPFYFGWAGVGRKQGTSP